MRRFVMVKFKNLYEKSLKIDMVLFVLKFVLYGYLGKKIFIKNSVVK